MIFGSLTLEQARIAIAGGIMLLIALAWAFHRLERRREGRLADFADAHLLARLVTTRVPGLRRPLNLLAWGGLACLLFALAEPRWGAPEPGARRGSREVLILLDTSESMNAANPAPSRLSRAQDKVAALAASCPGDRFGIVAFSGAAVIECPMTSDHDYFQTILQSISTDTLTEEGTNIAAALEEAHRYFNQSAGDERGGARDDRLVLIVSDGEDGGVPPSEAVQRLAEVSRIAVLGMGDERGAEVRLPDWMARSRFKPEGPTTHWSVLDEAGLSAIALAGGGLYVRSTLNNDDLATIQSEMARLEGFRGSESAQPRQPDRYRWPLALALLLLAAEGAWLAAMGPLGAALARRKEMADGAM